MDGLKVGLLPKQYFTELEIEVLVDEIEFCARVYSATGSYDIRSLKNGASNFPVYHFARLEDPPHFLAVVGKIPERVDMPVILHTGKRTRVPKLFDD